MYEYIYRGNLVVNQVKKKHRRNMPIYSWFAIYYYVSAFDRKRMAINIWAHEQYQYIIAI